MKINIKINDYCSASLYIENNLEEEVDYHFKNAGTSTWTVKINDEVKQKLSELKESLKRNLTEDIDEWIKEDIESRTEHSSRGGYKK